MKVDVTIRDPGNGGWFEPGDEVWGTVYIAMRDADAMPMTSIYLSGTLRLSSWPPAGDSARPHFPEGGALRITKTLFEVAKVVIPDRPQTPTKGQCIIPFSIPIPARLDLPPTINVSSPGLNVRVDYSVRLEVTRPGIFQKKLTSEKILLLQVACIPPVPTKTTATAMLPAEKLDPRAQSPHQEPYLPQYTPSIQTDLAVPAPPVLHIGQPLAMDLTASIPKDLPKRVGLIRPRSLYITLKALTRVEIGSVSREAVSCVEICSIRKDLVVRSSPRNDLYTFDRALWRDKLVPQIPPTFWSAYISRSYVLEVMVGFSCEALEIVKHVVLCVDVTVTPELGLGEPPPKYSATDPYDPRD